MSLKKKLLKQEFEDTKEVDVLMMTHDDEDEANVISFEECEAKIKFWVLDSIKREYNKYLKVIE